MSESQVQALSVSIDNHFDYTIALFAFVGDPPTAKMIRVVSEGSCHSWNYFETVVLKRIINLAGSSMNVFFVQGLKPGDSISKLAEQVLKESL